MPRIFAAFRNEYSGLSMLRSFPNNLKNRQREPLVTQPYTAGIGVPSLSLNNWIATISATHWPSPSDQVLPAPDDSNDRTAYIIQRRQPCDQIVAITGQTLRWIDGKRDPWQETYLNLRSPLRFDQYR